jgi:PAS domain S-box-containing protein
VGRRARDNRFQALADAFPAMAWASKSDGTRTWINDQGSQFFGTGLHNIDARWPIAVVHPDDSAHFSAAWTEAVEGGTGYEIEVRFRRYDGVYRWFLMRVIPVRDGNGVISEWLGMTTDIHDHKVADAAPGPGEPERRSFISTVTHDLRSPLTSIKGFAQLMQRRQSYDDRAVQAIVTQTERMARLLRDLSDANILETGQLQLDPERVDLVGLVQEVIDQASDASDSRPSLLTSAAEIEGWWDRNRLAQILLNLLSNAATYAPGAPVTVWLEHLGSQVRITVADGGPGIDAEMLPHIFNRSSWGRSPGDRASGLGLGLYISKRLIDAHGGHIEVESAPGKGAAFIITLPQRAATPMEQPAA